MSEFLYGLVIPPTKFIVWWEAHATCSSPPNNCTCTFYNKTENFSQSSLYFWVIRVTWVVQSKNWWHLLWPCDSKRAHFLLMTIQRQKEPKNQLDEMAWRHLMSLKIKQSYLLGPTKIWKNAELLFHFPLLAITMPLTLNFLNWSSKSLDITVKWYPFLVLCHCKNSVKVTLSVQL